MALLLPKLRSHFAEFLNNASPVGLGFSPHPPVSVYGTGMIQTIAAFLDAWLTHFPTLFRSASRLWIDVRICQYISYFACSGISIPGLCFPYVSPQFCYIIVQEFQPVIHRLRLSTSPYAPTYPEQISFTLETLDIRPRILTFLSLLIPAFSLLKNPLLLPVQLLLFKNAPLPINIR